MADDPDMKQRFSYDPAGRLASETYVDLDKTVHYSSNELGLLDTMQTPEGELVSYKRDAAGRTTSMSAPYSIGAVFHWDDRGRLDALAYANGTTAAYEYYPYDLLSRYSWQGMGETLFDHRYSYIADRRLAQQSENGFQWTYGYDPAGRLDEVAIQYH